MEANLETTDLRLFRLISMTFHYTQCSFFFPPLTSTRPRWVTRALVTAAASS